jgi:hypothetical protein
MPRPKRKIPIDYTSRDFASIKADLVRHAKKYYPETYKDFNEAGFGSLMLDTVAYIGDILSFYLDYQANESFLDTAVEYNNVLRHVKQLGYQFRGNPSAYGLCSFYILVPVSSTARGPDRRYLPIMRRFSEYSSINGTSYLLNEDVDFANPDNEVVVARVDSEGTPTAYAVKAFGQVISGDIMEDIISIGDFSKFRRVRLEGNNTAEVLSVLDSEGHEYYEVPYLSENVIYKPIINPSNYLDRVQSLLKPIIVPRRFVVEQERRGVGNLLNTFLVFGAGSEEELALESIADPTELILQRHGREYTSDTAFDPAKLLSTEKFGVGPANTKLTVRYRVNSSENVNASSDSVKEVISPRFLFRDSLDLVQADMDFVIDSLEVTNEEPIVGDITLPNSEELRRRAKDFFATQNRAVTRQDYVSMTYAMPEQFGAIKRANVVTDKDSFRRNLNLYVVSESRAGTLTETNNTIKQNLRVWLNRNKMINDTVDILDARILNFELHFSVIADVAANKHDVLNECIGAIRAEFRNHFDVGEPLYFSRVYNALKRVTKLSDVVDVWVEQKSGGRYSDLRFDLGAHISPDNRYISVPENVIMELKFTGEDIKGTIK